MAAPASTVSQFDKLFLHDIGAGYTPQNVGFLDAWIGREGGLNSPGFNLLNTTQKEPGSVPFNNVGVQAFPNVTEAAQANATALLNGMYNDLLSGFRSNSLSTNQNYQGLHSWSAGPNAAPQKGYWNLAGVPGVDPNNPLSQGDALNSFLTQASSAQALQDLANVQTAETQEQQWVLEQSKQANLEAGYQQENLGLSEADLRSQQAALVRQLGLAPQEQALQEHQYQQQFADMLRNYQTSGHQMASHEAGTGSMFTQGARDDRSNLFKNYQSSTNMLGWQKKAEELNYREQINALKDQQQALARQALRYGISEQEIKSRLAAQLSNIQYGGITSLYPLQQAALNDISTIAVNSVSGQNPPGTTGGGGGGGGKAKPKPKPPSDARNPSVHRGGVRTG